MIDLLLIEDTKYVIPKKATTDIKDSIVQAYINLFNTKVGSIKYAPTVGVGINHTKSMVYEANITIFNLIKDTYNISSCDVISLTDNGEAIIKINGDFTFSVTI